MNNTDTIYGRFHSCVKKHGTLHALTDGENTLTFSELDALVGNYACALSDMYGVRRGTRVGIVMAHGFDMIAAMLAVLRLGGCYVPCEPSFPEERIRFMMEDAGVSLLVTDGASEVSESCDIHVVACSMLRLPHRGCSDERLTEATPQSEAYVLYTSGTTGRPKGVRVTNANVCNYADAFDDEFRLVPGKDVTLQYSVSSFDIFVEEVFATLLNGCCLAIPTEETRDDFHTLVGFIKSCGVTVVSGFPYLIMEFNRLASLPPSLRLLISGGDVLRDAYIDRLKGKDVMVYNTYGPSETTVCTTYQRCDNISPMDDGTYPIGRAVSNVEVGIVDADGCPVAPGEAGEIAIYGAGVSAGYVTDCPEQRNFTVDVSGRRVYMSGDIGYRMADGRLAFLHRKDNQVMILGRRVECGEVTNVLSNCEGVDFGIVTANYDSDGLAYLTAYFVPKDTEDFSVAMLRREMASRLAPYLMPEYYVAMRALPMTSNGKVNADALPVILKEGRLVS